VAIAMTSHYPKITLGETRLWIYRNLYRQRRK
jgi:hypothetical protein